MVLVDMFKEEHEKIKLVILQIETILNHNPLNINDLKAKFNFLIELWDQHEEKEERFYKSMKREYSEIFPRGSFVDEHKELRGHLIVLNKAMKSKSEETLKVSFDTDGKMLFQKFRQHMQAENDFFDLVEVKHFERF
jgi:hypothetical protein